MADTPHPKLMQRILDAAEDVSLPRASIRHVEYNPRQISKAAFKRLCDSVRKFGLVVKPVANRRSVQCGFPPGSPMVFVGGNQRVDACDTVFETQDYRLKCSLIDVDMTTERELCVALNNPAMQGQWDLDLLSETISSIADDGGDVRDTGFSVNDLRLFMDDDLLTDVAGGGMGRTEQEQAESDTIDMLVSMREAGESGGKGQPDLFDDGGNGGDGGDDSEPEDRTQDVREDLRRKRAKYKGQQSESDNADFTLHLVFDNRDQLLRFIEEFEIDPTKRFIDGVDFAATVLDFDLRAGA